MVWTAAISEHTDSYMLHNTKKQRDFMHKIMIKLCSDMLNTAIFCDMTFKETRIEKN